MQPAARGGLVLLGAVVLTLAGPREATACKPDGQVCRTNQSCCGTSGNNGICVGGGPQVGFGTCCTPDCTGKACGDDGCGGSCGTCTAPATCGGGGTANVCGAPAVCGNGLIEPGEECDGGSFCLASCVLDYPGCCQFGTLGIASQGFFTADSGDPYECFL